MKELFSLYLLLSVLTVTAFSETVYLQDGRIIKGAIVNEDENSIIIDLGDYWQRIPKSNIEIRNSEKDEHITDSQSFKRIASSVVNNNSLSEIVLKAGISQGTHNYSGENILRNNIMSDTVTDAKTFTGEYYYYLSRNIGLGLGITNEIARLNAANSVFNFINGYIAIKIRSNLKANDNYYYYIVGHLGEGLLIGDYAYKFDTRGVKEKGGGYLGGGAGVVVKNTVFEACYSVNRGSIESVPFDTGNPVQIGTYKIEYSKINFSVGILF